jgi:hypothetical protein
MTFSRRPARRRLPREFVALLLGWLTATAAVYWFAQDRAVQAAWTAIQVGSLPRGKGGSEKPPCRPVYTYGTIRGFFGTAHVCLKRCEGSADCPFGWRCNDNGIEEWAPLDACVPGRKWW